MGPVLVHCHVAEVIGDLVTSVAEPDRVIEGLLGILAHYVRSVGVVYMMELDPTPGTAGSTDHGLDAINHDPGTSVGNSVFHLHIDIIN